MVGVPGRSKACHTCKRRRKGCDERRPSCGQCTLSRIPCGGYDQRRIFVNSSQKYSDAGNVAGRFEAAVYSTGRTSLSSSPFALLEHTQSCVSGEHRHSATTWPRLAHSFFLDRSLERTAGESKYLEMYWTSLLPHGQAIPHQAARYSTTSWPVAVQDLYREDPLVRATLLSNALTLTGQRNGHPSLTMQGWRLYGRSLQAVARSLTDKKRQDWGGILAASGLLAAFELLLTADRNRSSLPAPTWLKHTSGEMAIILAGGPESFAEGHAHRLFADYRLHLIYPYLQNRTRCPLSDLRWKTVPWSKRPKWPKDKLLDTLIDVPGILEDIGALTMLSSELKRQSLLREDIEERCWLYDHQLISWSTSCGLATVAFVERLITNQDQDNDSNESAPSSTDLAMAHLGMIYWTTYNLLSQIISWVREIAPPGEDKDQLPSRLDAHQYCRKVVMLIPYFQKPGVGSYFISFVGFPATVAISFLAKQDTSVNFSEARGLLAKVFRGEHGTQLQRFLATWPWMTRHESETLGLRRS